MKLTMALLLGTLVTMTYAQSQSTFKVEKLAATELTDLQAAQTKLDEAQANFDRISTKIKESHGQSKPSNVVTASCIQGGTSVELRGEYALITSEWYNVCGTSATFTDNTK